MLMLCKNKKISGKERFCKAVPRLTDSELLDTCEIAMSYQLSEIRHTNRPMNKRSAAAADG